MARSWRKTTPFFLRVPPPVSVGKGFFVPLKRARDPSEESGLSMAAEASCRHAAALR